MKLSNILLLFILTIFLLSGCLKSDFDDWWDDDTYLVSGILYSKNTKLKQVSTIALGFFDEVSYKLYLTNYEQYWYIDAEYEYDKKGRISKVSGPIYKDGEINVYISYNDYTYNSKNQLEKITNYSANIYEGFVNLRTYTYSYDKNGNKLKEVIEYPQTSPLRIDSTLYYYDKKRLKREDHYSDGYYGNEVWTSQLVSYIVYEYDNQDNLIKETNYFTTDNTPFRFSTHSYQNGVNVKTEVFNYSNNGKIREIRRYYDSNKNLIYRESEEISGSGSALSYVAKYEYS